MTCKEHLTSPSVNGSFRRHVFPVSVIYTGTETEINHRESAKEKLENTAANVIEQ